MIDLLCFMKSICSLNFSFYEYFAKQASLLVLGGEMKTGTRCRLQNVAKFPELRISLRKNKLLPFQVLFVFMFIIVHTSTLGNRKKSLFVLTKTINKFPFISHYNLMERRAGLKGTLSFLRISNFPEETMRSP